MNEIYDEILGPKSFFVWVKENPLWWICYRTVVAGHWKQDDVTEFNQSRARYFIYFDHSMTNDACLFARMILERDRYFKAVKVSKIARDGEKVMVFIGKGSERIRHLKTLSQKFGFDFWGVRDKNDLTDYEKTMNKKYDEYLFNLGMAFRNTQQDDISFTPK